jgi:GNAT superfamily N-acetyltransferase
MDNVKVTGYIPGAIGRVTELHATYYSKHWGFDLFFETKVATELSELLNRFDESRDGFWVATVNGRIVGSIAIDGKEVQTDDARLRFFIVDPEFQGRGLGSMLLREAIGFCRRSNFRRLHLSTFAGLDPARHLYEKFGFVLGEEQEDNHWGKTVVEQTFELIL